MEMMIEQAADAADRYELMSDGIVAEIEDKLFMIFTYGPEPRFYLADIHAGRIAAAISMDDYSCNIRTGWDIFNRSPIECKHHILRKTVGCP